MQIQTESHEWNQTLLDNGVSLTWDDVLCRYVVSATGCLAKHSEQIRVGDALCYANGQALESTSAYSSAMKHSSMSMLFRFDHTSLFSPLAEALKSNTTIQQLDVSANGLGADGGKALAASIAENRTIISVSYK